MEKEIGFIGLGNMGQPMVLNLLKAGFRVNVYNRTVEKSKVVEAAGAQRVNSPKDTVTEGGIVITMVANDQALEEIVYGPDGIGQKLGPNGIHLSMSTVPPETSRKLASFHRKNESYYVASPVFGRPEAAAAKKLFIMSAGETTAKERVEPIQEALGQRVFDIGEDPSQANVIKLGGNFMIMAAMEAMAEAFTLAEKSGIDPKVAADIYSSTIFNSPVYQGYGKIIAENKFEPAGFQLSLGLKDCNLVLKEANETKTPMPMANLVHSRLLASTAKERGNQDWSAIAKIVREDAGLK